MNPSAFDEETTITHQAPVSDEATTHPSAFEQRECRERPASRPPHNHPLPVHDNRIHLESAIIPSRTCTRTYARARGNTESNH